MSARITLPDNFVTVVDTIDSCAQGLHEEIFGHSAEILKSETRPAGRAKESSLAKSYFERGIVYEKLKEPQLAQKDFKAALEHRSTHHAATAYLAENLVRNGQLDEAFNLLSTTRTDPKFAHLMQQPHILYRLEQAWTVYYRFGGYHSESNGQLETANEWYTASQEIAGNACREFLQKTPGTTIASPTYRASLTDLALACLLLNNLQKLKKIARSPTITNNPQAREVLSCVRDGDAHAARKMLLEFRL
jgi:tetratricopeptide (TPR) repeat protein